MKLKSDQFTPLGPLQGRVMQHIWRNGPSTVHDVHGALNAQPGSDQLAYTTILTVMRSLAKRELLDQEPVGRFHRFTALSTQEAYVDDLLRNLRDGLLGGNGGLLLSIVKELR